MNKKQYNNVIEHTLKLEQTEDSLSTARAIFDNMGVALPQGDMKTVYETIKTDDYMGWKSCTMQEVQAAADRGVAAIGISEDRIVVISANDEEQPVTQTASVMTLTENTSAFAVEGMQYYVYSNGGKTEYVNLYFANDSLNVKVGWNGYNPVYGATTTTIYWYSSDNEVVVVDELSGYMHAVGMGSALITAVTANGYRADFYVEVEELTKRVETEKTIFGAVVNDVIGAQAYRVLLTMTYHIIKIRNGKAYIGEISAFTKYDKGNIAYGLNYPDVTIGRLKIGNDTYSMSSDNRDMLVSPSWKWDAKVINLNKWYDLNTAVSLLSIVMLDASLFPYRDVELETTITA